MCVQRSLRPDGAGDTRGGEQSKRADRCKAEHGESERREWRTKDRTSGEIDSGSDCGKNCAFGGFIRRVEEGRRHANHASSSAITWRSSASRVQGKLSALTVSSGYLAHLKAIDHAGRVNGGLGNDAAEGALRALRLKRMLGRCLPGVRNTTDKVCSIRDIFPLTFR